jgi:general secretion pathway protein D
MEVGGTMKRVLWSVAFFVFSAAASAATIRVDPAAALTVVGGTADINVHIADVQDLYAYQFDIAYDPAVVSVVSITEGDFLAGGGSTLFVPGSVDNTAGTIAFTANTLLSPVPGVSGSGTLVTLRFAASGTGTSPVTLSNVVLLDSTLSEVAATVQNGSVSVVPEPGTALLLTAGMVVGLIVRGRKNARR